MSAVSTFYEIGERAYQARVAGNVQLAEALEAEQEQARIASINALDHEKKAMNIDYKAMFAEAFKTT